MKIKIVSDGTPQGTKVVDEAGNTIEYVQDVMWYGAADGTILAKLTILNVEAELAGEAEVTEVYGKV